MNNNYMVGSILKKKNNLYNKNIFQNGYRDIKISIQKYLIIRNKYLTIINILCKYYKIMHIYIHSKYVFWRFNGVL